MDKFQWMPDNYWNTPGTGPSSTPPHYSSFVNGYATTASTGLSLGPSNRMVPPVQFITGYRQSLFQPKTAVQSSVITVVTS